MSRAQSGLLTRGLLSWGLQNGVTSQTQWAPRECGTSVLSPHTHQCRSNSYNNVITYRTRYRTDIIAVTFPYPNHLDDLTCKWFY